MLPNGQIADYIRIFIRLQRVGTFNSKTLGNSNKKLKRIGKTLLKVIISGVALYFVFQKVSFSAIWEALLKVKVLWFVIALIGYNLSKIISAIRTFVFYKNINIRLDFKTNLVLYYIGMFFNLFLPGAVGGDVYKVAKLREYNDDISYKRLAAVTLADRFSGLSLLIVLGSIFFFFSSFNFNEQPVFFYANALLLVATIPGLYLFFKYIWKAETSKRFMKTSFLSFLVQFIQVLCAICLLQAVTITDHYFDYLTLFLASSVASSLPLTIGGVGARELVFVYGYNFLLVDQEKSIAFTFLFFMLTVFSAIPGLVLYLLTFYEKKNARLDEVH